MNTVRHVLAHATKCYPSSTAIVEGDRRVTYRELGEIVAQTMTVLRDLGVTRGDRVAVLAQNSTQFVALWLAAPMIGAALAPLNTRLTAHELRPIIEEYDPRLLLTDGNLAAARNVAPSGAKVQPMGKAFSALVAAAEPSEPSSIVTEDEVMSVVYTGGTTGRSKGVMLTHRNRLSDALSMVAALRLTPGDVWLNCSPVFHTSGTFCLLPTFWTGATLLIEHKFDAALYADRVQAEGVTIGFMVPKMIQDLLDVLGPDDPRLSTLRFLGHGGAPITETLLREACDRLPGVEFASMYGATELGPMATLFQHQERFSGSGRFASCGHPMLGVEVRVLDDNGESVPTRSIGEVAVRGPNMMKGYFRRPDATSEAIVAGFYRTGDLGYLDEEGYLYIADRKKDLIISGGENIYSLEVETVVAEFPGVIEVAVYGRPDEVWGETVCATIVAVGKLDLEALRAHCRERLAGYKQPRHVEVVQTPLPRTPAGKVSKRELRAAADGNLSSTTQ
ncbi:MAG: AMP-binding protein [Caulobacter sp.]|nr:AMP-binding protein [Caulobacter sp.]